MDARAQETEPSHAGLGTCTLELAYFGFEGEQVLVGFAAANDAGTGAVHENFGRTRSRVVVARQYDAVGPRAEEGQSFARPEVSLSCTACHMNSPSDSRNAIRTPLSPVTLGFLGLSLLVPT